MSKTYECVICQGVNYAGKLQCSTCGTIPAHYSLSRKPARVRDNELGDMISGFIEVVASHGCERADRTKYAKMGMRTVPADYYADLTE